MLNIKNILLTIAAVSIIATPAESFSLNFLKRGFKFLEKIVTNPHHYGIIFTHE